MNPAAEPTAPRRVLPLIVGAQLIGTSSWFAVNAVMPDLQAAYVAGMRRRMQKTVWQNATCTAFYRKNMTKGSEPGDFEIMVGGNSEVLQKVKVTMN